MAVTVTVNCIQCSRTLRLPSESLGSAVKCPMCQATFTTRALPDGGAEVLPVALPPLPASPPPKPERPAAPNLSLDDDDDVPEAPLVRRHAAKDDEEVADRPYQLVDDPADEAKRSRDDDRPRRRPRRDDEDRPRRREDDEEDRPRRRRDEDDRDEPRRRSSPDAVKFSVVVEKDPNDRLEGRFNAEADSEGLRLWRGRGRTLEVKAGEAETAKELSGARISVPLDGRTVELTVIEPEGRSLDLAEQVVEVLTGEREQISLPKPPGSKLGWLIPVPIGIPLLAVLFGHSIGGVCGGIGWGLLAVVASGLSALYIFGTSWAASKRTVWAGSTIIVAYLMLMCGFKLDRPGVSASGWQEYKGDNGGLTVKMPGSDPGSSFWKGQSLRGLGVRMAYLKHPRADVTFEAGVGEFKPEAMRGLRTPLDRLSFGEQVVTGHFELFKPPAIPGDPSPPTNRLRPMFNLPVPGNAPAVREYEWELANGRYACVRLVAQGKQLMILCVTSDSDINRNSTEVRQFFDSASMATTDAGPLAADVGNPNPVPRPNPMPRPNPIPIPNPNPIPPPVGVKPPPVVRVELPKYHTRMRVNANGQDRECERAALSSDRSRLVVWGKPVPELLSYDSRTLNLEAKQFVVGSGRGLAASSATTVVPHGPWVRLLEKGRSVNLHQTGGFSSTDLVAISGDGKVFVSTHPDTVLRKTHSVVTWDATARKMLERIATPSAPTTAALTGDGASVFVGVADDGHIRRYDAKTGKEADKLESHAASVTALVVADDGKRLASGDKDGHVRLWSASPYKVTKSIGNAHTGRVLAVAFSPDGRMLLTAGEDKKVVLWDAEQGTKLFTFDQTSAVLAAGFAAKDKALLTVTTDGHINRYDLERIPEVAQRLGAAPKDEPQKDDKTSQRKIEAHLCVAVDAKGGYLLAFTKAKQCLHYSYPDLKLLGSCGVEDEFHNVFLDPTRGVAYASTAEDHRHRQGQHYPKVTAGKVLVLDLRSLRAEKEDAGPAKVKVTLPLEGAFFGLADGGGRLITLDIRTSNKDVNFRQAVVNAYDGTTYKLTAQQEVMRDTTLLRVSPEGDSLFVVARESSGAHTIQALDARTLAVGEKAVLTDLSPLWFFGVSADYVIVPNTGARRRDVTFLDRKKAGLSAAMTWPNLGNIHSLDVRGERVVALYSAQGAAWSPVSFFDLAPRAASREARPGVVCEAPKNHVLYETCTVTPDARYLIYLAGQVVPTGIEPPKEKPVKEPVPKTEKEPGPKDERRSELLPAPATEPAEAVKPEPRVEAPPPKEVSRTSLGRLQDVVFDPAGKQMYALTSIRTVRQYRYPDFEPLGRVSLSGGLVFRAHLDPETQTLTVLHGSGLSPLPSGGQRATLGGGLAIFSLDDRKLKDPKAATKSFNLLAPTKTHRVAGPIALPVFSADGKSLYYLDTKANCLVRVDVGTGKAEKTTEFDKPAIGSCLTPKGTEAWVIVSDGKADGKLFRFASADLVAKGSHPLDFVPDQVVATDSGRVCVLGRKDGQPVVDWLEAGTEIKPLHRKKLRPGLLLLCLAADQKSVYLVPRTAAKEADIEAAPTAAAEFLPRPLARLPDSWSCPRWPIVSPDGAFLINPGSGELVRLTKE